MAIELEKFIKIMSLTQSDQDGECLNAIRMANALLKKNNIQWEEIIKPRSNTQKESPRPSKTRRDEENDSESINVRYMINYCLQRKPYSKFLQAMSVFYNDKGFLTERQQEVLTSIYNQIQDEWK